MTLEQLRRVDAINLFSITCPAIHPIDYARFAILNESERENYLKAHENMVAKMKAEKEKMLLN